MIKIVQGYLILTCLAIIGAIALMVTTQTWVRNIVFIYWALFAVVTVIEVAHKFTYRFLNERKAIAGLRYRQNRRVLYAVLRVFGEPILAILFLYIGLHHHYIWVAAIGCEYTAMCICRLALLRLRRGSHDRQRAAAIRIGWNLLILALAMYGVILYSAFQLRAYLYYQAMIMAVFVFTLIQLFDLWLRSQMRPLRRDWLHQTMNTVDLYELCASFFFVITGIVDALGIDAAAAMPIDIIAATVIMMLMVVLMRQMIRRGQMDIDRQVEAERKQADDS
ncbi:hypothetical protein [Catenisphaera adipataccumulans]|jgi:hypothetical protein|uniref:Uncharacterized protein n=1 Tax=Catenisphaera adipataccumulans TaxID=700500 RepID=A0A7W8CZC2_9FIRM|nr:hypothetical protein [Catenisphaera adipataccumulans]MBB5183092.1 hypothetical protein [Catenisphaera adipataccumulans]